MKQTVMVLGPNLRDQSRGSLEVHEVGCADLPRAIKRQFGVSAELANAVAHRIRFDYSVNALDCEAESKLDVAEFMYPRNEFEWDEDADEWEEDIYLNDFHFAPCVLLPRRTDAQEEHVSAR